MASEVDEELAFHLEMRAAELERSGVAADAAREQARAELGDLTDLRHSLVRTDARLERRRRWWAWVEDLRQDVRHAGRALWKTPGFAAVALATLTLGIGAAVAIFTVVNAVLLRPLPYPEPDRLVLLSPGQNANIALSDAVAAGTPSVEAMTGLSTWQLTLTGVGEATTLTAQFVDAGFFRVFGVRPLHGRAFEAEERSPDRSDVVLISHALWQTRFGGDRSIVGRRIALDGSQHATRLVIGIMPPDFVAPLARVGQRVDLWAPLSVPSGRTIATDSTWYVNWLLGRLAPGATVARASGEVRATMSRLRQEYSGLIDEDSPRTAHATELLEAQVGDVTNTLWVLLASVGLVLLLACANLANLLLARGDRRRGELAVRAALGAGRGRLIRAQLAESAVLALVGGAGGVLFARVVLAGLRVADISGLPRLSVLQPDGRVLLFALVSSVLALVAFGLLPAWRATDGVARYDLRSAGRSRGRTRSSRQLGFVLVAAEVALAMVLVTGAALLLTSLRSLRAVDTGLDTGDVLTLEVSPPSSKYSGARGRLFYDEVRAQLAALPGVRDVGGIQLMPFTDANWSFPYLAADHAPPPDGRLPSANFRIITPGYFAAVDVPVLAGRDVEPGDDADHAKVGWINRALAEQLWPGENAVGKEIQLFGNQPFRIVGVVGDVRQHALDRTPEPEMYQAHGQVSWAVSLVLMVEADVPPASLIAAARRVVAAIDPDVPVKARPFDDVLGESLARRRFFAGVMSFFGVVAMVLGAVGVYGVMTHSIGARLPEFGLRMALGATRSSVVRSALAAALAPVVLGLAAGGLGAVWAAGLIASLLYGVQPQDLDTLLAAAFVLGIVATLASWLPAYRVTRVDPAGVLRAQ